MWSCAFFQMKNMMLKIEQETQKRNLTQNDLKAQNQQLSSLRTSEKQLKQELNHLLDIKRSLEKQNQELRKSVMSSFVCFVPLLHESLFFIRLTKLFFDCRERQDADGQMKELQDQLEAEQYFSVSVFFFCFTNYLEAISKHTLCFHNIPVKKACCLFLPKQYSFSYCQMKC